MKLIIFFIRSLRVYWPFSVISPRRWIVLGFPQQHIARHEEQRNCIRRNQKRKCCRGEQYCHQINLLGKHKYSNYQVCNLIASIFVPIECCRIRLFGSLKPQRESRFLLGATKWCTVCRWDCACSPLPYVTTCHIWFRPTNHKSTRRIECSWRTTRCIIRSKLAVGPRSVTCICCATKFQWAKNTVRF